MGIAIRRRAGKHAGIGIQRDYRVAVAMDVKIGTPELANRARQSIGLCCVSCFSSCAALRFGPTAGSKSEDRRIPVSDT